MIGRLISLRRKKKRFLSPQNAQNAGHEPIKFSWQLHIRAAMQMVAYHVEKYPGGVGAQVDQTLHVKAPR